MFRFKEKAAVTVVCLTYNHEKYIKKALMSILSQHTNFVFNLIVFDDHSTDETRLIIKDYEKKYPDVLKAIYSKKNTWSTLPKNQGIKQYVFSKITSKYVAFCDGDDYWIDDNKLQIQYDYMESHLNCGLCFHSTKIIDSKTKQETLFPQVLFYKNKNMQFNFGTLLSLNFIQTSSVFYRWKFRKGLNLIFNKNMENISSIPNDIMPLDWYLHLTHSNNCDIGFVSNFNNTPMSVYVRHEDSLWYLSNVTYQKWYLNNALYHINFWQVIKNKYGYSNDVEISDLFSKLIEIVSKSRDELCFHKIVNEYSDLLEQYLNEKLSFKSQIGINPEYKKISVILNALQRRQELWDENYYLSQNVDLSKNIDNSFLIEVFSKRYLLFLHYLVEGWKQGVNPSILFDTNKYLEVYQDVKNAQVNPLEHYLVYGELEGRKIFSVDVGIDS